MTSPAVDQRDVTNISNMVLMVSMRFDSNGSRYAAASALAASLSVSVAFNLLITIIIARDPLLHSPMFIFMVVVAVSDIVSSASAIPRVTANLLGFNRISLGEAVSQMFFVHLATRTQTFTLSVMALDRYLAVVFPLRYRSLMSNAMALRAVASVLAAALAFCLINVYILEAMQACRPMVTAALICDALSVLRMLCGDATHAVRYAYVMLVAAVILPALFICLMYALILAEVCKRGASGGGDTGAHGRLKALRTCGTHLLTVSLYFVAILFSFANGFAGVESFPDGWKVFFQVAHFVLPPALNPVIYGLGTAQIRKRICKMSLRGSVRPDQD